MVRSASLHTFVYVYVLSSVAVADFFFYQFALLAGAKPTPQAAATAECFLIVITGPVFLFVCLLSPRWNRSERGLIEQTLALVPCCNMTTAVCALFIFIFQQSALGQQVRATANS